MHPPKILVDLNNALFPSWTRHLKRELRGCTSVLDIGCGKDSPIQECEVSYSVGVDLFDAYLKESKRKKIHSEYVKADIRTVDFPPNSFDCVMCLEVLEHLTKEEGLALLARMEKWARKKIVLTTPNTFVWQDEVDDNPLQAHQSGWTAKELRRLGFKVRGLKGWRTLRGYRGACKYRPMFFWAKLSHISQKFVYFVPGLAFQLFIVKDLDKAGLSAASKQASMTNGVCAIIVTYRVGKDVLRGFESVRRQVQETVFVDNGGDRETIAVLQEIEKAHADAKVFYNPQNVGIAAALNIGVHYALQKQYRWVLTLDHDSEATSGMVNGLVGAYKMLSEAGISKVAIVAPEMIDRNVPSPAAPAPRDNTVQEVATCISSGSLIDCRVFAEVGFFNESLFLYYVDDDFCLRCADRGWKVYVCRTARLLHSEGFRRQRSFMGRSFIYRNYGPAARYYMARNAIYMLKKHFRHGRYCRGVIKRISSDIVTTLLFGSQRWTLMRSMLTGFGHGLIGRYGKAFKQKD